MELNDLSAAVIGSAIEVHRELGPGLLESVYQKCLAYELENRDIDFELEASLPVVYKTMTIESAYRLDMLIDSRLIVELKAVDQLAPIYSAQLLSYLKLSSLKLGLLINFNVKVLTKGIRRIVNNF